MPDQVLMKSHCALTEAEPEINLKAVDVSLTWHEVQVRFSSYRSQTPDGGDECQSAIAEKTILLLF